MFKITKVGNYSLLYFKKETWNPTLLFDWCSPVYFHRPEWRDISGNFKRTPSTKFETTISERRPKLFRVAHVFHVFALTIYKLFVSGYGFCRRDVNKKYKTTADLVVLVEVLVFWLWKSATCHFFVWEVTFEAKYLFAKSLYSCVRICIC